MTDEMKARLAELKKIAEADLTAEQKTELGLLSTIEKQDGQLVERQNFINVKTGEVDALKNKLEAAKPEDKAAIQAQLDDKQALVDTLSEALEIAKEANEKLLKISSGTPGHGGTVDQKTIDELEDKLLDTDGGKEAMEKACENMSDSDFARFDIENKDHYDPEFRRKVMSAALSSVRSEETGRSPWRKKVENRGAPLEDESKRIQELFGNEQRQHRKLRGGGGGGGRPAIRPPAKTERVMDDSTY